jgi:hypothetical protein
VSLALGYLAVHAATALVRRVKVVR